MVFRKTLINAIIAACSGGSIEVTYGISISSVSFDIVILSTRASYSAPISYIAIRVGLDRS